MTTKDLNAKEPQKTQEEGKVNLDALSDWELKKLVGKEALKLVGKACVLSVAAIAAGALTTSMFGSGPIGGGLALFIAYGAGTAAFAPWLSKSIQKIGEYGKTFLRRKDPRAYHEKSQDKAFEKMKVQDTISKSLLKTAAYSGAILGTVLFGTALGFIAYSGIPWFMACATAYTGYKALKAFGPGFKTHAKDWYYLKTHPLEGDRISRSDLPRRPGRGDEDFNYHQTKNNDKLTRVSISTETALKQSPPKKNTEKEDKDNNLKPEYALSKKVPVLNITIGKDR